MPIRVRGVYSIYRYWGLPSRYVDAISHLDPSRFKVDLQGVPDVEIPSELPTWMEPSSGWLRAWIRSGRMPWYTFSDLQGEALCRDACRDGRVDIVHFLDGEHSGQFLPRFLRRHGDTRTVATFHQPPAVAERVINGDLLRWFDAVVLVSPSQRPFFEKFVSPERLHVILHGVDTVRFHPANAPSAPGSFRCVTTGLNLRDWDAFAGVADALPDVTFVVATSVKLEVPRRANVEVHAGISDEALSDLYRSADVLFLPLLDATANNSLLEGIASGLPVVATNHEAVRSYVSERESFLIDGNDVGSFVAAMRRLAEDSTLRSRMGGFARRRAEELTWSRIANEYESLYALIAESNASKPRASQIGIPAHPASLGPPATHAAKAPFVDTGAISELSPGALADLDVWGHALIDAGMHNEGALLFGSLATLLPEDPRVQGGLAAVAEVSWDWKSAVQHWDRVGSVSKTWEATIYSISRKSRVLVQMGLVDEALRLYETISDHFEGLEGLARIATLEATPGVAARAWEECTSRFPERIEGYLQWAGMLIDAAEFDRAEGLLSHIIGVWPTSVEAEVLRSVCAGEAGKTDIAARRWERLVARYPTQRKVWMGYARYLGASREKARADCFLDAATLADPTEFWLEYHVGGQDLREALQCAKSLVETQPGSAQARFRLLELLIREGSPDALNAASIESAGLRESSPDSVVVKAAFVELLIRKGQTPEALDALRTIPATEKGITVQILRAWAQEQTSRMGTSVDTWRTIFLDFEMLNASRKTDWRARIH